jgi:hypothetical protein
MSVSTRREEDVWGGAASDIVTFRAKCSMSSSNCATALWKFAFGWRIAPTSGIH